MLYYCTFTTRGGPTSAIITLAWSHFTIFLVSIHNTRSYKCQWPWSRIEAQCVAQGHFSRDTRGGWMIYFDIILSITQACLTFKDSFMLIVYISAYGECVSLDMVKSLCWLYCTWCSPQMFTQSILYGGLCPRVDLNQGWNICGRYLYLSISIFVFFIPPLHYICLITWVSRDFRIAHI